MAPPLVQRLFALSPELRYVAVRDGDSLLLEQRPGIRAASASESDPIRGAPREPNAPGPGPAAREHRLRRGQVRAGPLRELLGGGRAHAPGARGGRAGAERRGAGADRGIDRRSDSRGRN